MVGFEGAAGEALVGGAGGGGRGDDGEGGGGRADGAFAFKPLLDVDALAWLMLDGL